MRTHDSRSATRVGLAIASLLLTAVTSHAVEVISGPTLTMNPNGQTPLAGVVELETDVAVLARITITDGTDLWSVEFPDASQQHYLPVLGLKPDRTYTVDIELTPGGYVGSVFPTTGPLPADFPTLVTTVSSPEAMEPGYTLLDCFRRGSNDSRPKYSAIVDSAGEVVWYNTAWCWSAARQLANGNIMLRTGYLVIELDLLSNEKRRVQLEHPGVGMHHDLLRTPHGTYLSLVWYSVDVDEFPTSETDPEAPTAPATLRDDSVVEFLPDGTLRREWPLVEMLHPMRIGYNSLEQKPGGLDWSHSNAVNYRLDDDSIIASVRYQDAVIKFSRETGNLQWILGPHDNWPSGFQQYLLTPVGSPFSWHFHQHAPMWTPSGTILLFDNGNHRASPFDGNVPMLDSESYSRSVEFEIDEIEMEVQQVWEYGESIPEQIYSRFISDADWLETTGNRLNTFGGTFYVGGVSSADLGLGEIHARIIETTDDVVPVKVFELIAYDPTGGEIRVYRAERIPSLYPLHYFKAPNGVGDTVRMARASDVPQASWTASPVDATHDAAGYYMVYASTSAVEGFTLLDSTAYTGIELEDNAEPLLFYRLVAANSAGTSGDEPAP